MNENPMAPRHPMQCTAKNRKGKQCTQRPIPGGTVCRFHGGSAPQVKAAARLRVLALVDPALARLEKLIRDKNTPAAVRLGAIRDVLDRAGIGKGFMLAGEDSGEAGTTWEQFLVAYRGRSGDGDATGSERR